METWDIKYKSVQIEPTNRCNLKCRICWHTFGGIKKFGDMNFNLFKTIINQFNGITDLNLQGLGEPFLAPNLLNMVVYANDKGINVWLASNLNFDIMDEKFIHDIIRSGLTKIRISIDASNEKKYADVKKGGFLGKAIDAIYSINKAKKKYSSNLPVLAFNTVAMKRNVKDLKNIIELAHRLDIREIALIPLVIFNKGIATNEESLSNNLPLVNKYINGIIKTAQDLDIKLEEGISAMVHPKEMGLKSVVTTKCVSSCYVDCFGFLYPCCNVKYSFGNFKNDNLFRMINNDKYLFFKDNILEKRINCVSCMEILNKC